MQKEEKLLDKTPKTENTIKISRALRLLIFLGFVCLSIIMSGDNGVVSSSSKMIKKDLSNCFKEEGKGRKYVSYLKEWCLYLLNLHQSQSPFHLPSYPSLHH